MHICVFGRPRHRPERRPAWLAGSCSTLRGALRAPARGFRQGSSRLGLGFGVWPQREGHREVGGRMSGVNGGWPAAVLASRPLILEVAFCAKCSHGAHARLSTSRARAGRPARLPARLPECPSHLPARPGRPRGPPAQSPGTAGGIGRSFGAWFAGGAACARIGRQPRWLANPRWRHSRMPDIRECRRPTRPEPTRPGAARPDPTRPIRPAAHPPNRRWLVVVEERRCAPARFLRSALGAEVSRAGLAPRPPVSLNQCSFF